jgi:hypothetical protein
MIPATNNTEGAAMMRRVVGWFGFQWYREIEQEKNEVAEGNQRLMAAVTENTRTRLRASVTADKTRTVLRDLISTHTKGDSQ